jgi:MoaA/NifB/PqqE/SkfB family radical SAM enzyme
LPHYKKNQYASITGSFDIDSFYLNLKNIKKINKIPLMVNMVVNKKTLNEVYSEAEFLYKNYGVNNFAATPLVLPAIVKKNIEEYALSNEDIVFLFQTLLDLNKDFGIKVDSLETVPRCFLPESIKNNPLNIFSRACSAGRTTITLDYEGNVRGCSHDPNNYGNVFKTKFSDIFG